MSEINFENWFGIYQEKIRIGGYKGPVDQDSAREQYDNDVEPEDAASMFLIEMDEI